MSKTYRIAFTETLYRVVEIDAKDENMALQLAEDMYKNEVVVLDANDFLDYSIDLE